MSSLRKSIEAILNREKQFGHNSFLEGLTSDEQVECKYTLICDGINDIDMQKPESDGDKSHILYEMIECGLLSPEAAAYILVENYPNSEPAFVFIKNAFAKKSREDSYLFFIYIL